jgi:hypothetical protein
MIEHQGLAHNQPVKTTFDLFSITQAASGESAPPTTITPINISPVGYLACDPVSYLLNAHWDREVRKRCGVCGHVYSRPVYRHHVLSCKPVEENKPSQDGGAEMVVVNGDCKEETDDVSVVEVVSGATEVSPGMLVKEILNEIVASVEALDANEALISSDVLLDESLDDVVKTDAKDGEFFLTKKLFAKNRKY